MLYIAATSGVFVVIIGWMLLNFRQSRRETAEAHEEKFRTSDNKVKLMELLAGEMADVTTRLCKSVGALGKDVDGMRQTLRVAAAEAAAEAMEGRGPAQRLEMALRMAPSDKSKQVESTLGMANRIFDDMNALLSIWNGSFERQESGFDLYDLIQEIIDDFQEFLESKPNVHIAFNPPAPLGCHGDPAHVSRCIRAILAQALKQTKLGEVKVRVLMSEAIMRRKAELVVIIEDNSSGKGAYDVTPDKVHKNPFLKDDASATLRLNLAQQTAAKLGGKLSFHRKKLGNVAFRFAFSAIVDGKEE